MRCCVGWEAQGSARATAGITLEPRSRRGQPWCTVLAAKMDADAARVEMECIGLRAFCTGMLWRRSAAPCLTGSRCAARQALLKQGHAPLCR